MKLKFAQKLKPEALKWYFWQKSHRLSFLLFLNCFRVNQMGFEQVFDNVTFKHMDALRKQIQSLLDPGGGGVLDQILDGDVPSRFQKHTRSLYQFFQNVYPTLYQFFKNIYPTLYQFSEKMDTGSNTNCENHEK